MNAQEIRQLVKRCDPDQLRSRMRLLKMSMGFINHPYNEELYQKVEDVLDRKPTHRHVDIRHRNGKCKVVVAGRSN